MGRYDTSAGEQEWLVPAVIRHAERRVSDDNTVQPGQDRNESRNAATYVF